MFVKANSAYIDEMLNNAVFYLGLHCLQIENTRLGVSGTQKVLT